jgi:hypothetical protein
MDYASLFWLPAAAVILHIIEEFVWPGGFASWYKAYRPDIAASITPRFTITVNAALVTFSICVGVMGPLISRGASVWLGLVGALANNGLYHLIGTWRTRTYSPGVVTGTLAYIPLAVFGFFYMVDGGYTSARVAVISIALGGLYQLWSYYNHRRRVVRAVEHAGSPIR